MSATLTFDRADVRVQHHERFDRIELRGAYPDIRVDHEGQPQLPVKIAWLVLPPGTAVASANIRVLASERLDGEYTPYPIVTEESQDEEPSWDSHLVFPPDPAIFLGSGDFRTYRMAKVAVWPLTWYAQDRHLEVATAIAIVLELRPLSARESAASIGTHRPEAVDGPFGTFRDWVERKAVNREDVARFYPRYEVPLPENDGQKTLALGVDNPLEENKLVVSDCPSTAGLGVDCLIITSDTDENGGDLSTSIGSMSDQLRRHADLLTSYGLVTVVKTLSEIEECVGTPQFDRPAMIREFLKQAYESWATTYVLLGGDEAVIPTRRLSGNWYAREDLPSDRWYTRVGPGWEEFWNADGDGRIGENDGDLDHTDNGSMLHVHRLPARDATEASIMVDKTERYLLFGEAGAEPIDESFYDRALVVAGLTHGTDELHNMIDKSEFLIAETLEGAPGRTWDVTRLYPRFDGPTVTIGSSECLCYEDEQARIESYYAPGSPTYWETDRFRDELRAGAHFVWHMEHSHHTLLGDPTVYIDRIEFLPDLFVDCGTLTPAQQDHCRTDLWLDQAPVEDLTASQVLGLDNAVTYPNYSIVASGGSITNQFEVDAVGEAFLRARDGGAVVYVGQSKSYFELGTYLLDGYTQRFVESFCNPGGIPIGDAWFEVVEDDGSNHLMSTSAIVSLGDPLVWMWAGVPGALDVEVNPYPLPSGRIDASVQVRQAGTAIPVPEARVCLSQRDAYGNYWLYVAGKTGENGVILFKDIDVSRDPDFDTFVRVLKPGWRPYEEEVPVGAADGPLLVYSSYAVDDAGAWGDGDGILEVGERVTVAVTLKNVGTETAATSSVRLRPSPTVHFQLAINEEFRPAAIDIGRAGAHPEAYSDLFRLPYPNRGLRAEGKPPAVGLHERFQVWRDDLTGKYSVSAVSPSQSADSLFRGVITTETSFANVTHNAGAQDVVVVTADSIYFEIHGSPVDRTISFQAEATEWCSVVTGTGYVPATEPGDSVDVEFDLDFLGAMSGRDNLLFTVTTHDGEVMSPYVHSDFLMQPLAPSVQLAMVLRSWGDWGCADTTWKIVPSVTNYGTANADSVVLTLHVDSGSMTALDSTVVFTDVATGAIAPGSDAFLLCGADVSDTTGFGASIDVVVYKDQRPLPVDQAPEIEGGGGCIPLNSLRAELLDGAIALVWEPGEPELVERYFIGVAADLQGTDLEWIATLGPAVSRFEVREVSGIPIEYAAGPYYFFVTASGDTQCGPFDVLSVGPVYPWLGERPGWPVLLNAKSDSAPIVLDGPFVGPKVLASTDVVYLLEDDGRSVTGTDAEGRPRPIYDPVVFDSSLQPENRMPHRNYRGASSMDLLDPGYPTWLGAQVLLTHGLHLFEMVPPILADLGWTSTHLYYRGKPVDGPVLIPPHEQTGLPHLVFAPGRDDPYIYAYRVSNGTAFGASDGSFAAYPEPATYGAIALGYDTANEKYEIVASTVKGSVAVYPIPASATSRQPARWTQDLGALALSQPVVGDIDGDGDNDIVVASAQDTVSVLDEESGTVLYTVDPGSDLDPAYPSLANLDSDDALEIVICSGGENGQCTLYVLDHVGSSLVLHEVTSSVPDTQVTQLRDDDLRATGPAVAVDYDFEGTPSTSKVELIVGTTGDALFVFEYDPGAESKLSAKPGWPLLFQDEPLTPALVQFDGSEGPWTIVVQTRDGWLHAFDLPSGGDPLPSQWVAHGATPQNTFSVLENDPTEERPQEESPVGANPGLSLLRISPQPSAGTQELRFNLGLGQAVAIDVFDINGRHVRTVLDSRLDPGAHTVSWDGRAASGQAAASGVYWYRIRWSGGLETVRTVVVR